MATIKLIVQLVEDDGEVNHSETDVPLALFKDPDLANKEDRLHAASQAFEFLGKSLHHFVAYWAQSAAATEFFKRIERYAREQGMGEVDTAALVAGAISSPGGTQHLQLPLKVLNPKEGEDIPRPGFPSRYQRKPVI